jgi:hypothetical protein
MKFLQRVDPIVPGFLCGLFLSVAALVGLHYAASGQNMLSDRMAGDPEMRTGLHVARSIAQAPVEILIVGRGEFLDDMAGFVPVDTNVAYIDTRVFDLRTLSAIVPLLMRVPADSIYLEFNPRDWKGISQIEPPIDIYSINDIALSKPNPKDFRKSIAMGYRMLQTIPIVVCASCAPGHVDPAKDRSARRVDIDTVRKSFFENHRAYFGAEGSLGEKITWVALDDKALDSIASLHPFLSGQMDPLMGKLIAISDIAPGQMR